jgi:23S rRNA pseudouridine2605 synthase
VLVSLYVESVVAASSDEVETFLSPLAARSRVREVVNGLLATRQLELVSVGAQPLFHVTGSLPEFAEPAKAEVHASSAGETRAAVEKRADQPGGFKKRDTFEKRPPFEKRREGYERRPSGKKPFEKPAKRFGGQTFEGERSREGKERYARGGGKFPPKRFGKTGERTPWQERGERRPFERPAGRGGEGEFRPRRDERGERDAFSGELERGARRGKRPFFRERGSEPRRDFRFGSQSRSGKPKRERGGFPKQSKPEFRKAGEREFERSREHGEAGFRREGGPQFKSGGKPRFGKKRSGEGEAGQPGFKPGFKKGGFGKSPKSFGKPGTGPAKPFGKPANPFRKPGRAGFGKGKRGGFKPPFRKGKNGDSGKGE